MDKQDCGSSEQCIGSYSEADEEMLVTKGEHMKEFVSCAKEEKDDDTLKSSCTDQQEFQFVSVKEEMHPEPQVPVGENEADIFGEVAVPKESLHDNFDDNTQKDSKACPSVNSSRDLNGDSDRFIQEKNEHKTAGDIPKAVRKRRGRKPRYNRHLSEKPFQCKICQKCFKKPEHLKCHVLFHSEERPFSCDTCGKGFVTNGDLKRHRVVHTGEKPYTCPMCSKTFTQLCNMQSHLRKRCQPKRYSCDLCNTMFKDQEVLLKHKATHGTVAYYINNKRKKPFCQDLPPFICDICSLCFSNKRILISHIRAHMGEDNVICEICGKNCARKERLVVHMRSHTGEKPFSCSVCGKSFSQQCNLKKHEVLHLPD